MWLIILTRLKIVNRLNVFDDVNLLGRLAHDEHTLRPIFE